MIFYTTIQELIESVNEMEISYRNLHTTVNVKNNNDVIKIPYKSIIREYLPFFNKTVIDVPLTDNDKYTYKYKPKKMSLDLYGTTELWSAILEINHMYSITDFTLEKPIKIFDPKEFIPLLNEVMILENIIR